MKKQEDSSLVSDLLKDLKSANIRYFIIILVILTMWFATGCYLVYVLNDTEVVTTTETIDIEDVETVDDSNIQIGDN